jgi:WD40 repeat protein
VRSVNFSTDGKHLVTASDDKTAKVSGIDSQLYDATVLTAIPSHTQTDLGTSVSQIPMLVGGTQ